MYYNNTKKKNKKTNSHENYYQPKSNDIDNLQTNNSYIYKCQSNIIDHKQKRANAKT